MEPRVGAEMRIQLDDIGDRKGTGIGEAEIIDIGIVRHKSGRVFVRYLFDDLIGLLAKDMHDNVSNGWDNVVVVCGAEGSGKSNLAWQIAHAYNPTFDLTTNYVYSAEDFREKLKEGNDLKNTFWMDEGSNIANNRDWQSMDNKDFISILEMMRSRGWTLIFCIPSFERLDVYIREHRIRYLLECKPIQFSKDDAIRGRGYFELKKRTTSGFGFKTIGFGKFDPIPTDVKDIYEQIKLDAQQKKIEAVTSRYDDGPSTYKKKYEEQCRKTDEIMLRMYNSGLDKRHLMDLFGIDSDRTFENRIYRARRRNG